jgi:hypothetical protein
MPPKKDDKKPEGLTTFEQIGLFLLALYILSLIWARIQEVVAYYGIGNVSGIGNAFSLWFFGHFVPIFKMIVYSLSALCLIGIIFASKKLKSVEKEEKGIYGKENVSVEGKGEAVLKNDRWERIITHVNSANASDWRLAIIEADIMLDELLKAQGHHGDTLGERLRSVEKSEMLSLDNAWQAHRTRNEIAHAGSDFALSERDAKRAIAQYESVFKEFKIV